MSKALVPKRRQRHEGNLPISRRKSDLEIFVEATLPHLATKEDLANLRADMESGFGRLDTKIEATRTEFQKEFGRLDAKIEATRTEFQEGFGKLNAKIEATNTKIEASKNSQLRWLFLLLLTVLGLLYASQDRMENRLNRRIDEKFDDLKSLIIQGQSTQSSLESSSP